MTTSPSIFRLRPSAVYCGCGFFQDVNRGCGAFGRRFLLGRLGRGPSDPRSRWTAARRAWRLAEDSPVPLPKPVLATVPRIPLSPPVPLPYPGPPGNAGEPSRLTLVALFGSPLPAIPLGSPKPPVCTWFHRATTVAAAALPDPRIADFHIFFRPPRLILRRIDFRLLENRIEFHGLRLQGLGLGGSTFAARKRASVSDSASRVQAPPALVPAAHFGLHLHFRRRRRRCRRWRNRDFRNRLHQLRDT